MFLGRYYHHIELKGRVSLPVKFRAELDTEVVSTRGMDGCIYLYSVSTWQQMVSTLGKADMARKVDRDYVRLLLHEAVGLSIDEAGRVLLPEYLRASVNIKKHVVFAGSLDHIELWDQETYHKYIEQLEEKATEVSEAFADIHHLSGEKS